MDLDVVFRRETRRLPSFDYRMPGPYFITIRAYQRGRLFGSVVNTGVQLTQVGELVRNEWLRTPLVRPGVILDEWVIMPDHFHGILTLPTQPLTPTDGKLIDTGGRPPGYRPGSLASLVGGFKAVCTRVS